MSALAFRGDKEHEMSPHPSVFEHQLFRSGQQPGCVVLLTCCTAQANLNGQTACKIIGIMTLVLQHVDAWEE